LEPILKLTDENEDFGSLVGLEHGILLENQFHERKLIIPNGDVLVELTPVDLKSNAHRHHKVSVDLTSLHDPPFFLFDVNETLQELRGSDLTSWLYLARLHPTTSSPLPDPFTGLTGTESAIQIFQSGHAWTCEPYTNNLCIYLLQEFRMMSHVRKFHPKGAGMMEITDWPKFPASVSNEGFRFIVEKLMRDSQRFHELFERDNAELIKVACDPGSNDEILSRRAYFRYQPLCSPEELVSTEFMRVVPESPSTTIGFSGRVQKVDTETTDRIRLISHLGKSWTHSVHFYPTPNLHSFLLPNSGVALQGIRDHLAIASYGIEKLFKFNLRDNWMNLYELARTVSSSSEMRPGWTCLLSFLAFKGHTLDHLLLLHAVAVNPIFFRKHDPPKEEMGTFMSHFQIPTEKTFIPSEIYEIFFNASQDTESSDLLARILQSNWDPNTSETCSMGKIAYFHLILSLLDFGMLIRIFLIHLLEDFQDLSLPPDIS